MTDAYDPVVLRRDRLRVAAVFLVNGAMFGAWVSRIPQIADELDLGESALAVALLGLATATVVTLPLAGGLTSRVGARPVTVGGVVVAALGLAIVGTAGGTAALFATLFLYGTGSAAMDVSMNGHGVALERRYDRPIMVTFHALWSLGGLVSTALGGLLVRLGVSTTAHLVGTAVVLGALGLVAARTSPAAEVDISGRHAPLLARPRGALWVLGGIALASSFAEGAIADWSGVYLRRVVGTGTGTAAAGFAVFSATMAATRFAGDRVVARLGRRRVIRIGGLLAGTGSSAMLLAPSVPTVLIGVALAGVGLASLVPVAFSAAGDTGDAPPGEAVAAVSTVGYAGFIAGPPLIGLVAEATSLRVGLLILPIAAVALVVAAGRVPERPVRVSPAAAGSSSRPPAG